MTASSEGAWCAASKTERPTSAVVRSASSGERRALGFPDTKMNDDVRIEVENDLRDGRRAVQCDAAEVGATEPASRGIGIDAENRPNPRCLFQH